MLIRLASTYDTAAILALLPRLVEVEVPPWRERTHMTAVDSRIIAETLDKQPADCPVFIAEEDGKILGFIHIRPGTDHYEGKIYAHVSDIVVDKRAEGKGVAQSLIEHACRWAKANGFLRLSLNVFQSNQRARNVYEHLGFRPDTMRYVKVLDDSNDDHNN